MEDLIREEQTPNVPESQIEKEEVEVSAKTNSEIIEEKEEMEEGEELSLEEEKAIAQLGREELYKRLQELNQPDKLESSKRQIALIRLTYKEKTQELKMRLKTQFLEEGGEEDKFIFEDELDVKFNELTQEIKKYHQKKKEEKEALMAENLERKKALLGKLKKLIEEDQPLKQTYDEFNKFTEEWKTIYPIARAEANNLWESYHFLVEKFFDKIKINHELRDLDYKRNLAEKMALCEKAESLMLEESISKASRELHLLHERWKEIGPVGNDKKDEIWDRFKVASDAIAQRKKDYYDQRRAEMEKNLLAKKALCEQMEQFLAVERTSVKVWNEDGVKVDEFMKLWRSIGRATPEENDTIWAQFRGYINQFYERRKEFFRQLRDEQMNNYNLKLDLCVKAEHIAHDRNDFKTATQELLKLQQQWKEIGPVPFKVSDKIWKRFRTACDEFFRRKSEQYENLKNQEEENQKLKEQLVKEMQELPMDLSKEDLLAAVKDAQRRWTSIGHVPLKVKDQLYSDFRTAIDAHFNALGTDRRGIIGRVSTIETKEEAARLSNKEIARLNNKIAHLKSDIQLWMNNIGFLSSSKNSYILKQEFERKIEKSKQDLALLEAKLELLKK